MLSCAFMQGACPLHWYTSSIFWHTPWYTSSIPVLVCMFNPSLPGASTLDPPHVSFNHQSYTSLIYIFHSNLYITNINSIHSYLQVLMFNLSCDTHISSELQKVGVPLGIHSNLKCGSQVKFQDNSSWILRSFHRFQVQSLYNFFLVVVMVGSKGKEAFHRPLHQLKLHQEKAQLCWAFSPQAPLTNHRFDTDPWLSAKVWQMLG